MRFFTSAVAGAVFTTSLLWAQLATATDYRVNDLGPGTFHQVNNFRQVVGTVSVADDRPYGHIDEYTDIDSYWDAPNRMHQRAAIWEKGQITVLPTLPGGRNSWGTAINDQGRVAGTSYDRNTYPWTRDDMSYPMFLYQDGASSRLLKRQGVISLKGMNSRGLVVGYDAWSVFDIPYDGQAPRDPRRAIVIRNGQQVTIGTLGGSISAAHGVNYRGDVVGVSTTGGDDWHYEGLYRAFRYANGQMENLGTLGGDFSSASDINDRGEVVGASKDALGRTHAFLFRDGQMEDLTLSAHWAEANAINNASQIVGSFMDVAGGGERAFLFQDGAFLDLNTLFADLLQPGWTLVSGLSINDRGDILSLATLGGQSRHVLLTVVPEPSVLWMGVVGLGIVMLSRRRKTS